MRIHPHVKLAGPYMIVYPKDNTEFAQMKLLCGFVGLAAVVSAAAQEALGSWTDIHWDRGWYVRPVHLVLLPDQRLLIWDTGYMNGLPLPDMPHATTISPGTDYAYDVFTVGDAYNHTTNIFCAGHSYLWDGRLFVSGGHLVENGYGDDRVNVFDYRQPGGQFWTESTHRMTQFRWYPTSISLPDRSVLTLTGVGGSGHTTSDIPDLWMFGVPWESGLADYMAALPRKSDMDNFYPFVFIDPKDGNLFYASRGQQDENPFKNQKLNLATLAWTSPYSTFPNGTMNVRHFYPSAVIINAKNSQGVRESIIAMTGGSKSGETEPATANTLFCNLYEDPPIWHPAMPMNYARMNHVMVGLPTGDVIVFGGAREQGPSGVPDVPSAKLRTAPELWKPFAADRETRSWKLFNRPPTDERQIPRGYHSTAILLPDARIVTGGGEPDSGGPPGFEHQKVAQIFSPPYGGTDNWRSLRPTIGAGCPTVIRYGEPFNVTITPNATSGRPITKIMLTSLGAQTHAFNESQQIVELDFQNLGNNVLRITPPSSTSLMVPGPKMIFAVDDTDLGQQGQTRIVGIPSIAKMVSLDDLDPIFPSTGGILKGTAEQSINWSQPYALLLAAHVLLPR